MKETLRFTSSDGTRATFLREQTIRINYGSLDEIWCRNMVADGRIENVQIDGKTPLAEDQQRLGCLLDIGKRFGATMYRGQATTVCWSHDRSHDLIDSFPHAREFFDHDVTPARRIVELVVELPNKSRRFANATLEERVADDPSRNLDPPSVERKWYDPSRQN